MGKFRSESAFRVVVVMGLMLSVGLLGWCGNGCIAGCGPNYSDGIRAGVVMKCSDKGIVFRSHECTMNLGGMEKTENGMAPAMWNFYVPAGSVDLKRTLDEAIVAHRPVAVSYRQWFNSPIWYDADYEALSVK